MYSTGHLTRNLKSWAQTDYLLLGVRESTHIFWSLLRFLVSAAERILSFVGMHNERWLGRRPVTGRGPDDWSLYTLTRRPRYIHNIYIFIFVFSNVHAGCLVRYTLLWAGHVTIMTYATRQPIINTVTSSDVALLTSLHVCLHERMFHSTEYTTICTRRQQVRISYLCWVRLAANC